MNTDTRRGGTHRVLKQLVTQPATGKAMPSTSPKGRNHIKHKHRQMSTLLLLGGRGRTSLVQCTQDTLQVYKHILICRSFKCRHMPSVHPLTLPVSWTHFMGLLPSGWFSSVLSRKHVAFTSLFHRHPHIHKSPWLASAA